MGKSDGTGTVERERGWVVWVMAAVVVLAATLPFVPALKAPFIFDDVPNVVQNPALDRANIMEFFSDPTSFSAKEGNWPYRPLLLAFNALQHKISGLDPTGWRLWQMALHAINSVLVLLVGRKIFGLRLGAFSAALLFAAAPIQVQSVVYVSARSMVLAATPFLLSLLCLNWMAESQKKDAIVGWAVIAVLLALMSFLSSEGALALAVVAPAALYAKGADLRQKPYMAASLAVLGAAIIYIIARTALTPVAPFEAHAQASPDYSSVQNAFIQLRAPFFLARIFALPVHLSFFHAAPVPSSMFDPRALLPVLGLAAIGYLIYRWKNKTAFSAGLVWYLACLLPAVFVPLNVAWAEHRVYLALPGLVIMVGMLLERVFILLDNREARLGTAGRASFALVVIFMGAFSVSRANDWLSTRELFSQAVKVSPGHYAPWNFLAIDYFEEQECDESIHYLEMALKRNPNFADAYNTMVPCYLAKKQYRTARARAFQAVKINQENPTYWSTLAVTLMYNEQWEEAELALKKALSLAPEGHPNRPSIENNYRKLEMERTDKEDPGP